MTIEQLSKLGEPKFQAGDPVIYTNPQGVCWGEKIVVGHEVWEGEHYVDHRYFITPTDTPWYPVSQSCLEPQHVISHLRGLDLRVRFAQAKLDRPFMTDEDDTMLFLCMDVKELGRCDYLSGCYEPPLMFKGEAHLLCWWEDGQAEAAHSQGISECSSCHDASGNPCPMHG